MITPLLDAFQAALDLGPRLGLPSSGRSLASYGLDTFGAYLGVLLLPTAVFLLLDWSTKPRRLR